jgi:hypothetical protein
VRDTRLDTRHTAKAAAPGGVAVVFGPDAGGSGGCLFRLPGAGFTAWRTRSVCSLSSWFTSTSRVHG